MFCKTICITELFISFLAACRGKKSPLPGMTTNQPYHTLVGDPDLSWYLGLDPDVKLEDVDQGDCKASTVEVKKGPGCLQKIFYTFQTTNFITNICKKAESSKTSFFSYRYLDGEKSQSLVYIVQKAQKIQMIRFLKNGTKNWKPKSGGN